MAAGRGALVGRDVELAELDRALDELGEGRAVSLAVAGEPGIGKSRLLDELRVRSEERGHLVVRGTGSEFERYVPFASIIDALDPLLAARRDDLDDLPPSVLAELGAVFPACRVELGRGESQTADERYRVHRAVRTVLEQLASAHPLVLIIDDAHWADEASLELVQALLRRPPAAPVLLAVGYRPGQAPARLSAALAAPDLELIRLAPLTREQAAALLGVAPEAPSLAAIFGECGGNPFYLEQLARTGGASGHRMTAPAGGVPDGIAISVADELASIPGATRTMLESAAIAGDPFEPDVASEIAGFTLDDGLDRLDELVGLDLVRPTDVPRRFAFRHPLLHRAVYEGTQAGWRIAAHGRAAAALASRGASPAARARHVEHAARRGDAGAIALLVEAGRDSASTAPVVAARCFEAALRLMPADSPDQIEIHRELAQALRAAGQLERCRTVLLEAIELGPRSRTLVELTTACAAVERWLGQDRAAHARLVRTLGAMSDDDTAERAALLIELTIAGVFARDLDAAIGSGREALSIAERLAEPALAGAAAAALALAEAGAARIDDASCHRSQAAEILDAATDEEIAQQLDALYHLAWCENYLEHFDEAIAHVDRLIDVVRAANGARPLVPMLLVKCYPLETTGRLAEAASVCDAALEATQLDGAAHFLPWALFERSWAHHYRGELDEALACAEESIRLSHREIGGTGPSAGIGPAWAQACALIQAGRPERAAEIVRPLVGDDIDGSLPVERSLFWETLVLAELGAGDVAQAEAYVERAEQDAADTGLGIPRGAAQRARAELALATGDPARAAELAAASAEAFAAIGARIEVAFSRNVQGRALAELGDRNAAVGVLQTAEVELDACGSLRERDAARRELRRLGARVEIRGRDTGASTGLESLTDREREIAELITDRRTNREIAGQLFLSQKTIESHVRNLFVKLGVTSRVDVARVLERERRSPGSGVGGDAFGVPGDHLTR